MSIQVFCAFLTEFFISLLLNFESFLYVLDTYTVYIFIRYIIFNIFSNPVASLFIILAVSFEKQNFKFLMKSCLSCFPFVAWVNIYLFCLIGW